MTAAANPETLGFQTEAKKILHLMIHSLYSNKEIFLRELISNASDACDKLRFEALDKPEWLEGDPDPAIRISFDPEQGTLTIADNGIGMSREEVVDNLGTIARSGTAHFLESLSGDQKKDSQLIGQFGVGFYSSFIVADQVVVETRRAGASPDEGVRWSCHGEAEFTVETVAKAERGTAITLHLKADDKGFADQWRLRSIIKKYSDHIAVPVSLRTPRQGDEEGAEDKWEVVNDATALWVKPKNELSDDDYKNFYKHVSHDFRDPLSWSHNRVEGKLDYISLLYIPSEPQFDLYQRESPRGVKLYIQRTFIMDDAEQFLPLYLRFVKGVVDSNDLPLNVSREILQDSAAVTSIRTALTKRVLDMLEGMANNNPDDYRTFWEHFGSVLKEGLAEDYANRERIAKLLRFASTHSRDGKDLVSLEDYLGRAGERKKIYYLIADSYKAAVSSPYLEIFRKKGVEVLLLSDRIDEWLMSHLTEFDGHQFQNIAKGELDLEEGGDKAAADKDDDKSATSPLTEKIKGFLGERVEDVRITNRLTESPACLVVAEHELGVQMRRILEAAGQAVPETKPVLEINPDHPLMAIFAGDDQERAADLADVIYNQALISAGEQLDNPADFIHSLNRLLLRAAV